ncbi:MFS transporter [Massilia sp. LjRoot122]|uniref:MFS transporter n=1 Tax=Massilia sp. LjRoot122 TaxID=3342257 RepID=UPI003ECF98F9
MNQTMSAPGAGGRVAGRSQGLALIFIAGLPTMAIVSLVPNLPQLFGRFASVPHAGFWVPMILTLPSLCIALFSPLAGSLCDKIGRRPVMLASLALFTCVGVLPGTMDDLTSVLITRFFVGVAEAGILTSQNALMGDYFSGSTRQRWLGLLSVISPMIAAAFVLAGGMLGSISWHAPFLLYLLGAPTCIWAALSLHEPDRVAEVRSAATHAGSAFPWRAGLLVALVTIGMSVLYFVQAVQLGRIFHEHGIASPASISLYVTLASTGVVLGGIVFARMTGLSLPARISLMLLTLGIGYTGLGLAPNAGSALAFALVAQFGNGLTIPTLIGWALDKFSLEHRGRGMGVWASSFFIGTFLSPPLLDAVIVMSGSFLAAVAATGVLCVVLACLVFVMRGSAAQPAVNKTT